MKIVAVEDKKQNPPQIFCIRKKQRPKVEANLQLEDGDLLKSDSSTLSVRLNCHGAELVVLAPFRLKFNSSVKGCSTGFQTSGNGQLIVNSHGTPTDVNQGERKLASPTTQYAIKITKMKRKGLARLFPFLFSQPIQREWIVFEGEVVISFPATKKVVRTGQKLIDEGEKRNFIERVTPGDFAQAAQAHARLDVSQAINLPEQDREAAFQKLRQLHESVLAAPNDRENLNALAAARRQLGIPLWQADSSKSTIFESRLEVPYRAPTTTTTSRVEVLPPRRASTVRTEASLAVGPPPPLAHHPTAEQDSLFDLISQRKYRKAIAGFKLRIREGRSDSRDFYGLAVAYDQWNRVKARQKPRPTARRGIAAARPTSSRVLKRRTRTGIVRRQGPVHYAKRALQANETDHRLSEQEQNESRRIAHTKLQYKTP